MFTSIALMLALSGQVSEQTEIIVDFKDDAPQIDQSLWEAREKGYEFRLNSKFSDKRKIYLMKVETSKFEQFVYFLQQLTIVENVEENVQYRLPDDEYVIRSAPGVKSVSANAPVDDPMYDKQWSFQMIGLEKAWKKTQGDEEVIVAVIDTGVAYEDYQDFRLLEDLSGVKFVPGYDFVNDTEHADDDHGHGSHVTGTIAQATNNGKGVAGIAPNVSIMPLKVLSAQGSGTTADIAEAIMFAADNGARIINMSLGGGMPSKIMGDAVKYAHDKGVIVVCAAGNNGTGTVSYPAAYPGAFAVSSIGPTGELAYYSNWGKEIKLAAPGGDKKHGGDNGAILQNTLNPTDPSDVGFYGAYQGTSMAAPHVAGVAALVLSQHSGMEVEELEKTLTDSAKDVGRAGWDDHYGFGILSAENAVGAGTSHWWDNFSWVTWLGIIVFVFTAVLSFGGYRTNRDIDVLLFISHVAGVITCVNVIAALGITNSLVWSVLPLIIIGLFTLQWKPMRGTLIIASGVFGIYLLINSIFFVNFDDLTLMFGAGSWFDRGWLFINGLACLLWAFLIDRLKTVKRF